jgi:hypothetical protein
MRPAWVAGSVRARALAGRRLGTVAARELAAVRTAEDAVEALARSPYGWRVRAGDSLAQAQRGVAETLLWHLRVLAGWLPAAGAELLRLFAGGFELINIDEHVKAMAGGRAREPFRLGTLATAWTAVAATGSREETRRALAASAWGEPGGDSERQLQLTPRVRWAERVAGRVAAAQPWACGAVALLVAREVAAGRPLPTLAAAGAGRLLGPAASDAGSLAELRSRLRPSASWIFSEVPTPENLWRFEALWWKRVRVDGQRLLSRSGFGEDAVIGVVALLAADAALARAALEIAASGGGGGEVLDALA